MANQGNSKAWFSKMMSHICNKLFNTYWAHRIHSTVHSCVSPTLRKPYWYKGCAHTDYTY